MNNLSELTKFIYRLLKRKGKMEMRDIVKVCVLKFPGISNMKVCNSINNNISTPLPKFKRNPAPKGLDAYGKPKRSTYSVKG